MARRAAQGKGKGWLKVEGWVRSEGRSLFLRWRGWGVERVPAAVISGTGDKSAILWAVGRCEGPGCRMCLSPY